MKQLCTKRVSSFVFLILTVISLGAYWYFPPQIQTELWKMSSFGSISFSVALFAFPLVYWRVNILKLKWLGFLVTLFDVTIVLYLVMWTSSAVYWSPLVISLFNYILVSCRACGESGIVEEYEDLFSEYVIFTYVLGGLCSCLLWGIFFFLV